MVVRGENSIVEAGEISVDFSLPMAGFKIELDLVQKIIKDYTNLINAGKTIEFCWIPSHVNIPGNERADTDTAAKAALDLTVTSMKLPACELIPRVLKSYVSSFNMAVDLKLGFKLGFKPSLKLGLKPKSN